MVTIELDKPRTLIFDLKTIKDLERACDGKPLGDIHGEISRLGVTVINYALWAGLKSDDPSMTLSLALKIFQDYLKAGGSALALAKKLNEALLESGLFRLDEESEGNGQPAAN
jgi:hypothetical protein